MQTLLPSKPVQKTGLRTSPAHLLEVSSKEDCGGETEDTAEPLISRNVSERVCFRVLTFAYNGQQRCGTATWQPGLRTISLPDETKLEKSNFFFVHFVFHIDQLHNPFFVWSLEEKVLLTFLLAWREQRRKYTYMRNLKHKLTDLSVDHLIQPWVSAGSFWFIINI